MAANVLYLCSSKVIHGCKKNDGSCTKSFLGDAQRILVLQLAGKGNRNHRCYEQNKVSHRFTVYAVTKGSAESSKSEETMPSWAKPDSDEPPPWAQNEGKKDASESGFEVPFFIYLLASAITAIAAIGSIFEYANQRPVFGVVFPDSIFYVPLLGFLHLPAFPLLHFCGSNPFKLLTRKQRSKTREMAICSAKV